MRTLLLGLFLCIPMTSCTVVKDWAEEAAKEKVVEIVNDKLPQEELVAADTDKSGRVDWEELIAWLGGGGALAFVLRWLAARLKKKVSDLWAEVAPMRDVMVSEGKLPPRTG